MGNSVGWGQGAVNNAISWGQGAINNIVGWGSIYNKTFVGETDIIGSPIPNLILNFKTIVLADGGIFEAESSLNTILTNLNDI